MGFLIGNIANTILPARVKQAVYEDILMYGVIFPSNSTVGVRTYDAATPVWAGGSNSAITSIANDNIYDWALFPSNASGSSKTIVCNDCFWSVGGLRLIVLGGQAWDGSSDGLFCWYSDNAIDAPDVSLGALAIC